MAYELPRGDGQEFLPRKWPNPPGLAYIFNPGPATMLGACLIFGYCLSSYSYRWRDFNKYQTPILILSICSACAVGTILDDDANLILLGYIPWAICVGILESAVCHWLIRQLGASRSVCLGEASEKESRWINTDAREP